MWKGSCYTDSRSRRCRPSSSWKGWCRSQFNWRWRWLPIIIWSRGGLNRRWRGILGLESASYRLRPLLTDPWRPSSSRPRGLRGFDRSFVPESVYVDLADWSITCSHRPNRFKLASGFLMNRVFGSRGNLDTRHDNGWGDIGLVPSGDNHVGSFEEVGDSGGVGMEETLLLNGNTIPAPVYLNKFWEFRLFKCGCSV